MKVLFKLCVVGLLLGFSLNVAAQKTTYRCMVQMDSYSGEAAYVVISLINPKGQYERTLLMMGPDKQWYNGFKEWFKFYSKTNKVNARTGASIGGGDRRIVTIELEDALLGKGYKVRFETSVEEQKYYETDVELPATAEGLAGKIDGKGYIKYVRISKSQ